MKLNKIVERHKGEFVLMTPLKRNSKGYVKSWQVINTAAHLEQAKKLSDFYQEQGLIDVVIYDTSCKMILSWRWLRSGRSFSEFIMTRIICSGF